MDIEHSLDEILRCVDPPFAERFYAVLLEQFPRLQRLFADADWRSQSAMLTIGLQTVVQWYGRPTPAAEQYLRLVGDKHRRIGVQAADYQDFGSALLECLAQFHGEHWTPSLARQWSAAFKASLGVILQGDSESELHEGRLAHVSEMLQHVHARIGRFWHLLELTEKVNRGVLIDDVLNYVYEGFKHIIPYNRIGLAFIDENSGMVVASWARSDRPIYLECSYDAKLANSSLAQIVKTGRPRIINDLQKYLRGKPESVSTQLIVKEGMRSSLTCPLILLGRPIGFLFFSSTEVNTYKRAHVEFFQNIAGQLSVIVEKARLYAELQEQAKIIENHRQRLSNDLEFARRFQRSLILQGPVDLSGLSVVSLYEPASQVGGDLLEVVVLDDRRASVLVADAAGHGVKAAMLMAATKTAIGHARRSTTDPAAILHQVNSQLYDLLVDEGSFVTALCAVVDTSRKSLHVASAGHPFPWQYHAARGDVSYLDGKGGLPLGMAASANFETQTFPFDDEDAILICTDGVLEATNRNVELYGRRRLADLLREHGRRSAQQLMLAVHSDLTQFQNGVAANDDRPGRGQIGHRGVTATRCFAEVFYSS